MTRYIQVDTYTQVGFNYEEQNYFVTHKNTTTTRLSASEAKAIIDIVASGHSVTEAQILALSTTIETVTNIYYTFEDTGIGVKSFRFNTYKSYPLILDKNKLYIGGTNIIFDLTMKFSGTSITSDIHDFYYTKVGLNVTSADLLLLYNYLVNNVYNMHVYNHINPEPVNTVYYYDNLIKTSDYTETAKVSYEATYNPNNSYTYSTSLGNVLSIASTANLITLNGALPSGTTLAVNDKIQISNNTDNNGIYTVSGLYTESGNQCIVTAESLKADYALPVLKKSVQSGGSISYTTLGNIQSINKANKTITLNTTPSVSVGDSVLINNVLGFNDGVAYSVSSVSGSVVTVSDSTQFASDYTFSNVTLAKGTTVPEMLLNVLESADETKLPLTKFMLDNTSQLTSYLTLVNTSFGGNKVPIPTSANYSAFNQVIPNTITITGLSVTPQLEGLFSQAYGEEE